VTVVFINQIRMKIGVMFGSPETTTGGNALKFYASVRLDIRRTSTIKKGEEAVGMRARVKVVKNKVAPPFRQAEFDILYGRGIDRPAEVLDLGVLFGVVEKNGSWFSWGTERLGQGRENAQAYLLAEPGRLERLEAVVRERLSDGDPLLAVEGDEDGAEDARTDEVDLFVNAGGQGARLLQEAA